MEKFKELIIKGNIPLLKAMQILDNTEGKNLFVVDHRSQFIGSVTDGDIRRWILNGGKLDSPIISAAWRDAFTVRNPYTDADVKAEMAERDIHFVPILNERNEIEDILCNDSAIESIGDRTTINALDIPVVIMAGGKGTRLDPFTRILPKPLIPIGDKSILEIIIEKFLPYQVDHFYLSVNYKSAIIKSYFQEINPDYELSFIDEEKPLGTVGSLSKLVGKYKTPVLLTNCDNIIDADFNDIKHHHLKMKNDITMVASVKNYHIPYGVCEIEKGGNLLKILEKPVYNYLVNTGMYIISQSALEMIPVEQFFHVTHLMELIKKNGGQVGVYPISDDSWADTGEWGEYKNAMKKIAE